MKGLIILLAMALNIDGSVDGTWEGSCDGVASRGVYGTYNYQFADGSVDTFFRRYADSHCAISTTTLVPQAHGTYVLGQQAFGGQEKYHYIMTFTNSAPLEGTITIDQDVMQMCQTAPNAPCWSYHKR